MAWSVQPPSAMGQAATPTQRPRLGADVEAERDAFTRLVRCSAGRPP